MEYAWPQLVLHCAIWEKIYCIIYIYMVLNKYIIIFPNHISLVIPLSPRYIYIYIHHIIPYLFCEVPNWSLFTESLSRPRHPAEFPSSVVDQWGVRARSATVNSEELLHWEKSWRRTKDFWDWGWRCPGWK